MARWHMHPPSTTYEAFHQEPAGWACGWLRAAWIRPLPGILAYCQSVRFDWRDCYINSSRRTGSHSDAAVRQHRTLCWRQSRMITACDARRFNLVDDWFKRQLRLLLAVRYRHARSSTARESSPPGGAIRTLDRPDPPDQAAAHAPRPDISNQAPDSMARLSPCRKCVLNASKFRVRRRGRRYGICRMPCSQLSRFGAASMAIYTSSSSIELPCRATMAPSLSFISIGRQ
jgi:hypothetical protein